MNSSSSSYKSKLIEKPPRKSSSTSNAPSLTDDDDFHDTPATDGHMIADDTDQSAVHLQMAIATQADGYRPARLSAVVSLISHDIRRRPTQACIGCWSAAVVVGFVAILMAGFNLVNPLFLALNEDSLGNSDFIMTRRSNKTAGLDLAAIREAFIDSRIVDSAVSRLESVSGAAPRWILPGYAEINGNSKANIFFLMGNSSREIDINLGRGLNLKPLNKNAVYVSKDISDQLNLKEGSKFEVNIPWVKIAKEHFGLETIPDIDILFLLRDLLKEAFPSFSIPDKLLHEIDKSIKTVVMEAECAEIIDEPRGKWPSIMANVVYGEANHFLRLAYGRVIVNVAEAAISLGVVSTFEWMIYKDIVFGYIEKYFQPDSTTMTMNIVVKDKISTYSNFRDFKDKLIHISNGIMFNMPNESSYELNDFNSTGFSTLGLLSLFVQNIIACIITMLGIVGYFVLSSLTVLNAEEKNHQFNIVRSIGATKEFVRKVLIIQSLGLAVIGTSVGLGISVMVTNWIEIPTRRFTGLKVSVGLSWFPAMFIIGILGIVLPFVSTMTSLSPLSDSLAEKVRSGALKVKVKRLKDTQGFSNSGLIIGLELFVFGIGFFYFAPYFFITQRMDYFLLLLTLVLLSAIIGLVVLASEIISVLQSLAIKFVGKAKGWRWLHTLIHGDQATDTKSTLKTVWLVVALVVCFVMFTGSGIATQIKFINNMIIVINGADVVVTSNNIYKPLKEYELRQLFDKNAPCDGLASNVSFVSHSLNKFIKNFIVMPASMPGMNPSAVGIESNYLYTVDSRFYIPNLTPAAYENSKLTSGKTNGLSSIFEDEPDFIDIVDPYKVIVNSKNLTFSKSRVLRAVLPGGAMDILGFNFGDLTYLEMNQIKPLRLNFTHVADKIPGLSFSGYRTVVLGGSNIAMSMNSFSFLLDIIRNNSKETFAWDSPIAQNSTYRVPKGKMLIKLKNGVTDIEKARLKSELRLLIETSDIIVDRIDVEKGLHKLTSALGYFDIVICILFSILCLFLMLIGTVRRVSQSAQEIGMYKSIGLSSSQVVFLFKTEIFTGMGSAILVGIILGLIVSLIASITSSVLFEAAYDFHFPWIEISSLIITMVLSGILASTFSLKRVYKANVSRLLKGKI